jgi:hypothetical protein
MIITVTWAYQVEHDIGPVFPPLAGEDGVDLRLDHRRRPHLVAILDPHLRAGVKGSHRQQPARSGMLIGLRIVSRGIDTRLVGGFACCVWFSTVTDKETSFEASLLDVAKTDSSFPSMYPPYNNKNTPAAIGYCEASRSRGQLSDGQSEQCPAPSLEYPPL